ncbi:MAG: FkbM family methyltransferase [Candidatus Paceibacterota bacterium]|jgi:FkbM family methyltransferase
MKKIFQLVLNNLSKISGKKILYLSSSNYQEPKNFAVKSKYNFWYCGNVFDQGDIAYGIANNGLVDKYDSELVKKIITKLKKDFVFYDIGANTGWYTMLSSSINNDCTVHSFEPVQEHIDCLKESIFLNRKEKQVTIHEIALSNKKGEVEIKLAGTGSSIEENFLKVNKGSRKIKTNALDSFMEEMPLPDFIKIDVEGHEYKVLQGSDQIINKSKPILFIEICYSLNNDNRDFINKDFDDIFTFLNKKGYVVYKSDGSKLEKITTFEKKDGVDMYLFLNPEKHSDIIKSI